MEPNWEQFGRWILSRFCEGDTQIEMMDIQDMGTESGVLIEIPGGYDPEEHIDVTGASEPGDPFYNVAPTKPDTEAT